MHIFSTPTDSNYFFGYYDKSPLNQTNSKLLACRAPFIDKMPTKDDILEIGYFDWQSSNTFIKLCETRAWNWQQGCMLQWLENDHTSKIIYNDRIDNHFVTVIMDCDSKEKNFLPMAYYTASCNGDFVLCIDNERHCWYRPGYSYKGIENFHKKNPILEEDGIWYVNTQTKETKQIITLGQMLKISPLSSMMQGIHYLEHLMIAPDNKRFSFLHRWKTEDGGIYARLYTANVDGTEIYLLNDSGRMSHFCWRTNSEIVAWGGLKNPINTLRKYKNIAKYFIKPLMPIYRKLAGGNSVDGNTKLSKMVSGDSYILFKDKTTFKQRIFTERLYKDGHPSFSKANPHLMVTDTYPNSSLGFNEELILCDLKKNITSVIAQLKHNPEFANSPVRCDLHPKWSLDGNYICVDTLDQGCRSIYVYKN